VRDGAGEHAVTVGTAAPVDCTDSVPVRPQGATPAGAAPRADDRYAATGTGSGRTSTVSTTAVISSAGIPTRAACSRSFSGLDAW